LLPFQRLAMLLGSARESPPLEGQLASNGFDGVETFGPLYDDVAATRRLLVAMVSPRPPKFEWTFVFQGPHQGRAPIEILTFAHRSAAEKVKSILTFLALISGWLTRAIGRACCCTI
jgi:hypothetical protein